MDARAVTSLDQALEDIGLTAEESPGRELHDYFAWATTTSTAAYNDSADDVSDGLALPRWSWTGLRG